MAGENPSKLTKHERKMLRQSERKQEREALHTTHEQQKQKKKRTKAFTITTVVLIIAAGLFFMLKALAGTTPDTPEDLLQYTMKEHTNIALHVHPQLEIEILGKQYPIPANIGISEAGMRVIHTHDATGTLHVESPYPHQFSLKDFFTIWGKTFNQQCIFEYCSDEQHELIFTANGIPNDQYENIPLRDLDKIKIIYRGK